MRETELSLCRNEQRRFGGKGGSGNVEVKLLSSEGGSVLPYHMLPYQC